MIARGLRPRARSADADLLVMKSTEGLWRQKNKKKNAPRPFSSYSFLLGVVRDIIIGVVRDIIWRGLATSFLAVRHRGNGVIRDII